MSQHSPSSSYIATAATHGAYLGIIIIAIMIAQIFVKSNVLLGLLSLVAPVLGIYRYTVRYRNEYNQGKIGYWPAVRYGIVLFFFASIIVSAYGAIYNIIDPTLLDQSVEILAKLYQGTMSDEQIANMRVWAEAMKAPWAFFVVNMMGYCLFGTAIALLTSLFARKM